MTEINPKIVDGLPVCDRRCCYFGLRGRYAPKLCFTVNEGRICISSLLQQRDQAIKERDEARRDWCKLKCHSDAMNGIPGSGLAGYARQRDWDYLYESEKK